MKKDEVRQFFSECETGEFMLPEYFIVHGSIVEAGGMGGVGNITGHMIYYSHIANCIGPHDDVLDLGCGCGLSSRVYSLCTDGRVVAVDKRPAISAAQLWYPCDSVEYVALDFRHSDLPDGDFDTVAFTDVYEHLDEDVGHMVLCQLRERMRSGAKLMMSVPVIDKDAMDHVPWHLREFHSVRDVLDEVASFLHPENSVCFLTRGGVVAMQKGTYNGNSA